MVAFYTVLITLIINCWVVDRTMALYLSKIHDGRVNSHNMDRDFGEFLLSSAEKSIENNDVFWTDSDASKNDERFIQKLQQNSDIRTSLANIDYNSLSHPTTGNDVNFQPPNHLQRSNKRMRIDNNEIEDEIEEEGENDSVGCVQLCDGHQQQCYTTVQNRYDVYKCNMVRWRCRKKNRCWKHENCSKPWNRVLSYWHYFVSLRFLFLINISWFFLFFLKVFIFFSRLYLTTLVYVSR